MKAWLLRRAARSAPPGFYPSLSQRPAAPPQKLDLAYRNAPQPASERGKLAVVGRIDEHDREELIFTPRRVREAVRAEMAASAAIVGTHI